ncbi:MAG TPA: flagellar export chaperone FliS [Acidobacteriaceae bacterium]|nr:flagellar export chaperone FliS [Acidobacteriaceae bacterium]
MNATELTYRRTAAQGASGFGLLIALFDTLAGDLRRAAEAERNNNIEKRCEAANHALLLVGHLQDWLDRGDGGDLALQLGAFYSKLRRSVLEAQAKRSPQILEKLMAEVLEVRATWQEVEARSAANMEVPPWVHGPGFAGALAHAERTSASWSA